MGNSTHLTEQIRVGIRDCDDVGCSPASDSFVGLKPVRLTAKEQPPDGITRLLGIPPPYHRLDVVLEEDEGLIWREIHGRGEKIANHHVEALFWEERICHALYRCRALARNRDRQLGKHRADALKPKEWRTSGRKVISHWPGPGAKFRTALDRFWVPVMSRQVVDRVALPQAPKYLQSADLAASIRRMKERGT